MKKLRYEWVCTTCSLQGTLETEARSPELEKLLSQQFTQKHGLESPDCPKPDMTIVSIKDCE
jgi:hypothetical protein